MIVTPSTLTDEQIIIAYNNYWISVADAWRATSDEPDCLAKTEVRQRVCDAINQHTGSGR